MQTLAEEKDGSAALTSKKEKKVEVKRREKGRSQTTFVISCKRKEHT